jgi:benzodiazapine receptor
MMKLIVSFLITFSAAFLGSMATTPSLPGWYAGLRKPAFNPPNWIFGPVWTTLYGLMAVALFLVWKEGGRRHQVKVALLIFGVQLGLNIFWSFLFFEFQSPAWALAEIVVLWLMIVLTASRFFKISKSAGWLLIPYLLWVSFASVLNFFIVRLNS